MTDLDFYTDYPFHSDDVPGMLAPVRRVKLVSYDGDKYATVEYEGMQYNFKAGYLYDEPGRIMGTVIPTRIRIQNELQKHLYSYV